MPIKLLWTTLRPRGRRRPVLSLHSAKYRGYSIALVGIGHSGYGRHFLSLKDSPSDFVTAVCDTNSRTLKSFSEKHPDVPAYSSLPNLLINHKPDLALVSIPHEAHMESLTTLSHYRIPVLKEKPIADSADTFTRMTKLPVKIGITFQKRFEPRYVHFKKLLPLAGEIRAIHATLTLNIENLDTTWRAASGVGVTEDLGCHMIDLMTWLFGIPSSLMAYSASSARPSQKYSGDDVTDIIMNWSPSNQIGHIQLSRVAHQRVECITVTGTNGTLIVNGHKVLHVDPRGKTTLETVLPSIDKLTIRTMVGKFGHWVAGKEPGFEASLHNLRDTVSVVDAIQLSLATGQVQNPLHSLGERQTVLDNKRAVSSPF